MHSKLTAERVRLRAYLAAAIVALLWSLPLASLLAWALWSWPSLAVLSVYAVFALAVYDLVSRCERLDVLIEKRLRDK